MVSVRLSQAFVTLALAASTLTSVVAIPLSRNADHAVANVQMRAVAPATHFVARHEASGRSIFARADCADAKPWDNGTAYVGGSVVSYNGKTYTAKWWTQAEKPGSSDVWTEGASCGGSTDAPTSAPATTTAAPETSAPATTAAPGTSAPATTEPATSEPPSTTTAAPPPTQTGGSGNGGAGLKKHALIGYLHSSFANGAGYIPMKDVSDDWDVINLSFGEPDSPETGNIQYHMCPQTECPNVESEADFIAAVKEKVSKGKLVQLSIGGEKGQVRLETEAARDKFVETVGGIIDKYGLTGIDIDFEGQSMHLDAGDTDFENPKTAVIVNLIAALKSLKAKYGDKFSLTMAPETFFVQLAATFYGSGDFGGQDPRAGSFIPVIHALRDELTILHVQDYNSGPINDLAGTAQVMGSSDFHVAMTDILLNGFAVAGKKDKMFPPLRPDQVGFGVPSSEGAGNGYIDPTKIQAAYDCLSKGANCGAYKPKASYPDLRGVMTWSINWDHFNGDTFVKSMRSYLDGQ